MIVAEPELGPREAVTVEVIRLVTLRCVTVKFADRRPPGMVTDAGTEAARVFELVRNTLRPPEGATLVIVTVPTTRVEADPRTEPGAMTMFLRPGAWMVRLAVLKDEPIAALIVAVVTVFTAVVLIVNVAPVLPTPTVTVAGGLAAVAEEVILTLTPLPLELPGVAFSVTVPVLLVPPATEVGETVRSVTRNGLTVRLALAEVPFNFAEIDVVEAAVTSKCFTANVALVWPPATFTEPGTLAAFVTELLRLTVRPAEGAGPESVTVPVTVALDPPITFEADRLSD